MSLECSVCLQAFKHPKILPCFHTFCEGCLSAIVSKAVQAREQATSAKGKAAQAHEQATSATGIGFPCPMCRTVTKVPNGGVRAFQDNFYIGADVDLFRNGTSEPTFPACDVCVKRRKSELRESVEKTSTSKCVECDTFLCCDCVEVHNHLLRSHTLVSVTTAGKVKVARKAFCRTHLEEELRFFCLKCQIPVCRDCRMTSHAEGHTSVDLKDVTRKAKDSLIKALHVISGELIPAHESMMKLLASDLERKRVSANNVKDMIKQRIQELQKVLQEVKQDALKTVDDAVRGLEEEEKIHSDRLAHLRSQSDHVQRVLEGGSDAHIVLTAGNLKAIFAEGSTLFEPPVESGQTVLYDRSDDVHIEKIVESGHLNLDQWKTFAAGFAGKVRLKRKQQSVAHTSYLACVKRSVQQISEALSYCDSSDQICRALETLATV